MNRSEAIHSLLKVVAYELLQFIREQEASAKDRWVPAAGIKTALKLNFEAVPKGGTQRGEKGWLFAIIARILEDDGLVEHKKVGNRAFYRTKRSTRDGE